MHVNAEMLSMELSALARRVEEGKDVAVQSALCERMVGELGESELKQAEEGFLRLLQAFARYSPDKSQRASAALLAAQKKGVYFCQGPERLPAVIGMARQSELMEQALSEPAGWEALISASLEAFAPSEDGSSRGRADYGRQFLATLPTRAEADALEVKRGPRWPEHRSWRQEMLGVDKRQAKALAEALDKAEAGGMWGHLAKSDRAVAWAMECALGGNASRLKRAIEAGVRFDKLAPALAFEFLLKLSTQQFARLQEDYNEWGALPKSQAAKAQRDYAREREAIWSLMVQAGMPVARAPNAKPFDKSEALAAEWESSFAGGGSYGTAALLTQESLRGGALNGKALFYWAQLEQSGASDPRWEGRGAMSWAFERGMDPKRWSFEVVEALASRHDHVGPKIDSYLRALAQAGVALGARAEPLKMDKYGQSAPSLVAQLMRLGAGANGLMDAARIKVDVFERSSEGESPMEELLRLNRAGSYAERLAGLLDAAESARAGGREEMLAMRSKDGSGPMHWAARALCAKSVELLASFGADPMERDDKGRSAGHWAASKYGEKAIPKVGPTLDALTKAGMDWGALDKKGASALAALSARGPLEPLGALLKAEPGALFKKAGSGKSALEVLAQREDPQALVLAEVAVLSDSATSAAGKSKAPGRSRL